VKLHNLCSTEKTTKSKNLNLIRQVAAGKEQDINVISLRKPQRKREFGASGCTHDEGSNVTHGEIDYVNEHHILSWSSRDDGYEPPFPQFLTPQQSVTEQKYTRQSESNASDFFICLYSFFMVTITPAKSLDILYPREKVKQSHYRPGHALRVPGGRGSQTSRQLAHEGGKVVSPTHRPPLPPEIFLVPIYVRG
jgi:hypothetical protein